MELTNEKIHSALQKEAEKEAEAILHECVPESFWKKMGPKNEERARAIAVILVTAGAGVGARLMKDGIA